MPSTVGVCSWSLRPDGPDSLVHQLEAVGVTSLQLALDPIGTGPWELERTRNLLRERGITIVSGMQAMVGEDYSTLDAIRTTGGVRPDSTFRANLAAAKRNAQYREVFGVDLVSFHAGFLPEEEEDPLWESMTDRLAEIIDIYCARGVRVAFETGQEPVSTFARLLQEWDTEQVGVNFDPANVLLYGSGDPISTLERIAHRVFQVHLKDAVGSRAPDAWGTEVPLGQGEVDWPLFFQTLTNKQVEVPFMVERESGDNRLEDLSHGVGFARGYLP